MGTFKQKKLAKEIVNNLKRKKPLNKGTIVEKVGYTTAQAKKKAGEIINSKGVREELEILGFNEYSAKKVVSELMLSKRVNPNDRLKATDQVFKVVGAYAPEKLDVNKLNPFSTWSDAELAAAIKEAKAVLTKKK